MTSPYIIVAVSVGLSLLPALIWGAIFLYKHGEKRASVVRTFMFGGFMVLPLMIYRLLWEFFPGIDLVYQLQPLEHKEIIFSFFGGVGQFSLPLSLLLLFGTVGIIEEYFKNRVARDVDRDEITSIDDAIEFSIIAALGFAFAENTFYFITVWQGLGLEFMLQVFIFRALFSTFAHVLFSAVYGYHFGLAMFAKKTYRELERKSWLKKAIIWIHKKTHLKTADLFEDQQRFVGLFYAATLHAVFNILLELDITVFLVPFLILGFIHVMFLIWRRENHVEYKLSDQVDDI